ncbi:inversin-like [Lingula anatina]|uniref:Inversin-like n=1 Tax=Lingula anatina TaxID=7574 RepID=A0A2R2MNQ7_LINAN|nr:inversin-like [Lingula anatina]|eukprot:XP_023931844.1 inversin-like [Lingula anatina]
MDLIRAVLSDDTGEVKRLLRDGNYDVNGKYLYGLTPLHLAAQTSNADMVKLFLDSGADVNAEDWGGSTLLHWAEDGGHEDIVKLHLERGADPNITNEGGRTPLHEAMRQGPGDIVKLLLEHGADPNITDEWGRTPLHEAVGHGDIVKLLLEHGADPNIKHMGGRTPLHHAAHGGCKDIVKLLLERGADPNITDKDGETPLYKAVYKGHEGIVKLLLEHRADPNITDKGGRTPLHHAAHGGCKDIVKLLLERGADPNITDKDKLKPYDLAVKRNHEYIKIMLQRFSSPSIQTHLLQKVITAISEQVYVGDIRFLARKQLGILNAKLENIRRQNPNDAQEEAFQILWEWMKTKTGVTVHNLFKALKDQQLNECLDQVKNEYITLTEEILAKPDDEFKTFCSSLECTDGVTLSDMKKIDTICYVSDHMRYLGLPLQRFNANAKGRMAVFRLEWMGNYETPATSD